MSNVCEVVVTCAELVLGFADGPRASSFATVDVYRVATGRGAPNLDLGRAELGLARPSCIATSLARARAASMLSGPVRDVVGEVLKAALGTERTELTGEWGARNCVSEFCGILRATQCGKSGAEDRASAKACDTHVALARLGQTL